MSVVCQLHGRKAKKANRKSMIRKFVSKRYPILKKPNLRKFRCEGLFTLKISHNGHRCIEKVAKEQNISNGSNSAKLGCYLHHNKRCYLHTILNRTKRRALLQEYSKSI